MLQQFFSDKQLQKWLIRTFWESAWTVWNTSQVNFCLQRENNSPYYSDLVKQLSDTRKSYEAESEDAKNYRVASLESLKCQRDCTEWCKNNKGRTMREW